MGFLLRGDISFSDVSRNIEKISKKVNMIDWNSEGYKYGICSVPTLHNVRNTSLCALSNSILGQNFAELDQQHCLLTNFHENSQKVLEALQKKGLRAPLHTVH
jgi:hypothetical protein